MNLHRSFHFIGLVGNSSANTMRALSPSKDHTGTQWWPPKLGRPIILKLHSSLLITAWFKVIRTLLVWCLSLSLCPMWQTRIWVNAEKLPRVQFPSAYFLWGHFPRAPPESRERVFSAHICVSSSHCERHHSDLLFIHHISPLLSSCCPWRYLTKQTGSG